MIAENAQSLRGIAFRLCGFSAESLCAERLSAPWDAGRQEVSK
jgi:hypothetical protein